MRKYIIIISSAAAVLFLAIGFILLGVKSNVPKELMEYNSSGEWGAEAHTHIAAYMSEDAGFNYGSIMLTRYTLENAYTVDSIDTASALYSASAERRVTLVPMSGPRTANCAATVYFGDYFNFHKPRLIEGAYPKNDPIHTDAILIDELAAWQIFGTQSGVVGLEVNYNGYTYIVCGVTEVPEGVYTKVYGDYPRVYINSESAGLRGSNTVFSAFDAMIPDPITNYASGAVSTALSAYSPTVINIDERFSGKELEKLRKSRNDMMIDTNDIEYPFTEKAMLILGLKAADYHAAMKIMYYISAAFAVILFFAVYGPIVRFIGKLFKKLKF